MSSGKFAWEKMGRQRRADSAAREGRAIYLKNESASKRPKKHKKPVKAVMPFGKFKGHAVEKIPLWYLQWLVKECQNVPKAVLEAARRMFVEEIKHPSSEAVGSQYVPWSGDPLDCPFDGD